MLHAVERTAQHGVGEVSRTLEYCDANRERLPDAEMPCSPSNLLTGANKTGRDARNCALASAGCRVGVQVDAASQVEHVVNGCRNGSSEFNGWHRLLGFIPRVRERRLTAAFSRSQPIDSQLRRTSSRFCCKALLAAPRLNSVACNDKMGAISPMPKESPMLRILTTPRVAGKAF